MNPPNQRKALEISSQPLKYICYTTRLPFVIVAAMKFPSPLSSPLGQKPLGHADRMNQENLFPTGMSSSHILHMWMSIGSSLCIDEEDAKDLGWTQVRSGHSKIACSMGQEIKVEVTGKAGGGTSQLTHSTLSLSGKLSFAHWKS
jgi:hypothetical protein